MMKYSRKRDGLKNFVKRRLNEGIFVAAVVSGRSFATVKTVIAAKRPFQGYVSLSPTISPIVIPPVVVKWMEANKRRVMFSMWGWDSEMLERIQAVRSAAVEADPQAAAEAKAKKEAEQQIEESGMAECSFCNEEIIKNERLVWESDFLLEYCISARDHKHKPKIVWKVADG